MYEKYIESMPGTHEYMFYTFFAAYINQDIESIDEAIADFKQTTTNENQKLFVKAIDDFLELDYTESEKATFIEELSCGWIEAKTAKEQLIAIRNTVNK